MLRLFLGLILAVGLISSASAQSMSVEELRKKIDERVGGLSEYQNLLNDPDPERSLAALQIMMESGDDVLERIAREHGLLSTIPAVRRATLEAFFKTGPSLEITLKSDSIPENVLGYFRNEIGQQQGSVVSDGAYISTKVGAFKNQDGCWVYARATAKCLVRLSESGVSIFMFGKWHPFKLNEDGVLTGIMTTGWVTTPLAATIPVTR